MSGVVEERNCENASREIEGRKEWWDSAKTPPNFVDLESALKLEPGNTSVEDELARLVWAEKKALVIACKSFE